MFEAPEAIAFGVAYLVAVMILCVVGVIIPLMTAKEGELTPVQRCKGCRRLVEVAPGKYRCTVRGELVTAPDSCEDCL